MKVGEYGYAKEYKAAKAGSSQNCFMDYVGNTGRKSLKTTDMSLEEYKSYFDDKVNDLYTHPSQRNMNATLTVTDAAFERMRKDTGSN